MSHYLPAPYEAAPDDDLGAAVAATLTCTLALVTCWIIGVPAYDRIRLGIDAAQQDGQPSEAVIRLGATGLGWAVAVLFLVIGVISLLRRRARGGLIFGALLSIATTFLADNQFSTLAGVPNSWVFYGGVAVVIAALLPATKRWLRKPAAAAPPVMAAPLPQRIGQAQR